MHVVFGMALDGRNYPEFPGRCEGALGACVVGPSGLVRLLQTQLGLSSPATPPVVRIAAWQAKLEAAERSEKRFWSASLGADAWSTARLLLSWRDSLVESGWRPDVLTSPPDRLADIAAAEAWGAPVPRGRADHLHEVISAIGARGPVPRPVIPSSSLCTRCGGRRSAGCAIARVQPRRIKA